MARMFIDGVDAVLAGLQDMIDKTPKLRDDILEAEADVIEPAVKNSVVSEHLVRSGRLLKSISRKKTKSMGEPVIKIGPHGEHHRYIPRHGKGIATAAQVGLVHEYGYAPKNMPARKWLSKAVDKSKAKAFDAADAVYDKFLHKK